MTASAKPMANRSAPKFRYVRQAGYALLVFLGIAAVAGSQEQGLIPRLSHIQDTHTDRKPSVTAFPDYPSVARRDRIEGEATVCFRISSSGKIMSAKIKSRSHKIFVKPTLRAIRESAFEPLAPGKTLKPAKTCRTYRYRLDPVVVDPEED